MFKLSELGTTHLHLSNKVGNDRKRNTSNHLPFPAERESICSDVLFWTILIRENCSCYFQGTLRRPGCFYLIYTRTMFHIWQDAEIRFEPELLRLQQWATHIPKMLSIVSLTAVQIIVRFEVPEIMNKLTKNQIFISLYRFLLSLFMFIY